MNLKLFNDLAVTGVLESSTSPGVGRSVLRGHIQGENGSYFLFAVESNVVAGSIFIPHRGSFQIHYLGAGTHSIIESDAAQLPPCGVQNRAVKGAEPDLIKKVEPAKIKSQTEVVAAARMPVVDILVVYTAQARDGAGGQAGIDTLIDLAVAEANMVYQNSQVNLFLHLAESAKVTYEESGNLGFDLNRLINPKDGYLDEVGSMRTNCHADLVCMIVENSTIQSGFDLAGIAVQNANATNAFSVVQRAYAVGSYVFAHELGHNFGCQHDRADATSAGVFPYSYGNVFSADGWTYGTVMSYPGQRIPYFSNPGVSFLGVATGVRDTATNSADNAKTLNLRATTVAGFRSPAASTYAPLVSITSPPNNAVLFTKSNIVVSANATESGGVISEVDFFVNGVQVGSATAAPYSFLWTNTTAGTFTLTASAQSSLGMAVVSSPVTVTINDGPPANDNFANRQLISGTNILLSFDNLGATLEPGEPTDVQPAASTVWFTWTAPMTGGVQFSLPGHDFAAFMAVYTGNALTNLNLVSVFDSDTPSSFAAVEGVSYQIVVGGFSDSIDTGHATLQWQQFPSFTNDDFANATLIAGSSYLTTANNVAATQEPGEPVHDGNESGHSVWWRWTAPDNGTALISTGSGSGAVVVYVGNTFSNLTGIAGNEFAGDAYHTVASFDAAAGVTYSIVVDGTYGNSGSFELGLQFTPGPAPPSNDDFANRIPLVGENLVFSASNVGATRELGESGQPGNPVDNGSGWSVWWTWTAPTNGQLSINTGVGDAWVGIYTGTAVDQLTSVGANTGGVTVSVTPGTVYQIMLDSIFSQFTNNITLTFVPSITNLSNDNFTNAATLVGLPVAIAESNAGATKEPGEPNHGNNPGGQSVWFSWTSPINGNACIQVSGGWQWFYPLLGVYTGTNLTSLTTLGDAAYGYPYFAQPEVILPVTNGMTLQIAVDGYNGLVGQYGATGEFTLNITGSPTNDDFSGRTVLTGTNITVNASNFLATKEPGEPNHGNNPGGSSVWFSWTAPSNGSVTLAVSSSFAVVMGVYTGNSVTNLTGVQECSALPILNFDVTAGTVYQIAVDSAFNFFGTPTGPFTLSLAFSAPVVRPPNDDFANRTAITGTNLMIAASNTNATMEFDEPIIGGSPGINSVWWGWTAPATGRVNIDATGSTTPQLIGVYSGTVLTNLTVLGAGFTTNGFDAVAGESYDIDFAAWEGNGNPGYGQVIFGLTEQLAAPNDNFANRIVLVGTNLTVTGDNTGASHEPGESNHNTICSHSLWYSWTAPANGSLLVTSSSTVMYAFNQLYTGTTMASLVNAPPDPTVAGAYEVTAGTTYQLVVDSGGSQFGPFTLSLQLTPRPVNDAFANRIPLTGNLVRLQGSNIGATREFGEHLPANAQGATVWWTWTPTTSGNVTITGTSTFSPMLTFYTGSSLATLTPVTGPLVAGTTYQISLDGYQYGIDGSVGSVDYCLSLPGPPPNDNFANRQVYTGTINLPVGLITYATSEPGEPNYLGEAVGKSVWYSWTAPTTSRYLLSAAASDFGPQSVVAVYTGTELTNLSLVAGGAAPGITSFSAEAGTTYSISVDSVSLQSTGVVRLAIWPLPLNDEFADRFQITGTNITMTGTNAEATSEPGELLLGVGNTLWWSWTAPETGRVQLTFPDGSTVAEVFTGNSLSNLNLVASNPNTNALSFIAIAGNTYQISLDTATNLTPQIVTTTLTQMTEPTNDAFTNAFILSGSAIQTNGTNIGATLEPGESNQAGTNAASVWWKWTAPTTQRMTIATTGTLPDFLSSPFDTVFGIYTGSALTNLTLIEAGTNVGTFAAVSGTTYSISVAGVDGAMGYLNLSLMPTPLNDDFANRQVLKGYSVFASGNSTGATEEPGEGIYAVDPSGASVWFSWTAPASGTVNITYTGNGFFPALEVFTGSAISNLVGVTENSFFNPLSFTASAGTTYQIVLVGYSGGAGDYSFNLSLNALAVNDNFANRIVLAGTNLTVAADNTTATRQALDPNPGSVAGGHSLWWTYTAPATGSLSIDFSQTGFVPVIGVYTGTQLGHLTTVTNVTDYVKDQVVFNTTAGVNYQIMVDGYKGSFGNILLNLSFQPAPPNDNFSNRIPLSGTSFSISANNRGATEQAGEPMHAGLPGSHSLWWSWQAPASQVVTLTAEGDGFDTHLAVYKGSVLTGLSATASNYNGGILAEGVTFTAKQGTSYQIAVDSDFADFGDLTLSLTPTPVPPNDNFTNAINIVGFSASVTGTNTAATKEVGEPAPAGVAASHSIWWEWTAGISGSVEMDTIGSSFDTLLAVYTGSTVTNLSLIASNDDVPNGGGASQVTFNAVAGTTYRIQVDGFEGATGNVQLNVAMTPPPSLSLGKIQFANGRPTFQIHGTQTQFFQLQTSTNLVNWETILTNQFVTPEFDFIQPTNLISPMRFYRAIPWP